MQQQQPYLINGVDTLVGVVPPEWLRKDRLVIDNTQVAVAIHHRPSVVGHCVVFPKVACARLEDIHPDVFCALGMMLPLVKRAIRICTGYRSCGMVLQSGSATGQAVPHLYFEVALPPYLKPATHQLRGSAPHNKLKWTFPQTGGAIGKEQQELYVQMGPAR